MIVNFISVTKFVSEVKALFEICIFQNLFALKKIVLKIPSKNVDSEREKIVFQLLFKTYSLRLNYV